MITAKIDEAGCVFLMSKVWIVFITIRNLVLNLSWYLFEQIWLKKCREKMFGNFFILHRRARVVRLCARNTMRMSVSIVYTRALSFDCVRSSVKLFCTVVWVLIIAIHFLSTCWQIFNASVKRAMAHMPDWKLMVKAHICKGSFNRITATGRYIGQHQQLTDRPSKIASDC